MLTHDSGPPDMGNRADYWARRMTDASDPVSDTERGEFTAWLVASEENQMEYRRAVGIVQLMTSLPASAQSALISPSGEGRSESDKVAGRRNLLKFAGLAASVAVGLVTGGIYLENRGLFGESHSTGTGQTSTVKFSEGSVAYLNTRTHLRWLGTGNDRRVELLAGEALFDVVHDEARPFRVTMDGSEIVVLGTRFNVFRKDSGEVVVTVLEGSVEVRGFAQPSRPEWVQRLSANEELEYRPIGLVSEPRKTDGLRAAAWRSGLLKLPPEGATIMSVVTDLNRYTDKPIYIRDPHLADLKVSGQFNLRDVRSALQSVKMGVASTADVEVHESDDVYTLDLRPGRPERN